MAKILLIDDDVDLLATLSKSLKLERHTVEVAYDGTTGLEFALGASYEILIVDVSLPDMDGFEICRRFRAGGGKAPVMMLTGRGSIDDKEAGFNSGADDYLTKPFSTRELVARIGALLRRTGNLQSDLSVGSITLNAAQRRITKNGKPLSLLPIDHALLEFLLRHPDQAFSVETLIERVWPTDKFPTADAVRSAVKRIRAAVDDDGQPSIIETISKVGYRLNRPVS